VILGVYQPSWQTTHSYSETVTAAVSTSGQSSQNTTPHTSYMRWSQHCVFSLI
jgi:hypothetical protein